MESIAVVTDSTACLPEELIKQYNISVVPNEFVFENGIYRDGVDINPSRFYELLRKANKPPTTSPPAPGAYLEVYRRLSQNAGGILCITVSSKLSAMFDSARHAQEEAKGLLPETTINVLDSRTAAGGQGFVVLEAARAAASGKSLAQVTQAAEHIAEKVKVIGLMDTLHYLARGGRIPKAVAWAGSILGMKPIVQVSAGEVGLLERVRTKPRAVERLLAIVKERVGEKPVHINLMHADVPEEAEQLKAQVLTRFDCAEIYVTDFTPVMGAHAGPGVLALAFWA